MAGRNKSAPAEGGAEPRESAGFDESLERLERIVAELEGGELGLEGSIERYREGVELLRGCRERLHAFRKQVEELSELADEALRPYAGDPDLEEEP